MKTSKENVTLAFKVIKKNSSWISKIIGLKTRSDYSHVEAIIGNKWISSVEGKGVHVKPLKPLRDEYKYHSLGDIEMTSSQWTNFHAWIDSQNNRDYDYIGILWSHILPFRFDNRKKWFCSELVTKILQLLLVKESFSLYPHLTTPGDLAIMFKPEYKVKR